MKIENILLISGISILVISLAGQAYVQAQQAFQLGGKDIIVIAPPPGPQGKQGIQGKPGTNGTNGLQGIQGIAGMNGKNGTNGVAGKNGTTIICVWNATNSCQSFLPPNPASTPSVAIPKTNAPTFQPSPSITVRR